MALDLKIGYFSSKEKSGKSDLIPNFVQTYFELIQHTKKNLAIRCNEKNSNECLNYQKNFEIKLNHLRLELLKTELRPDEFKIKTAFIFGHKIEQNYVGHICTTPNRTEIKIGFNIGQHF